MIHKILAIIALFLFSIFYAYGQQSQRLCFNQLSVNDGLPQNTVNSMVQDGNGMMWIATTGGLARFDSYGVTSYLPDSHNHHAIATEATSNVFRDHQGSIWIGHHKGLSLYRSEKGTFLNFSLSNHSAISDIVELDSIHLLVNAQGRLMLFNTTDFRFRPFRFRSLQVKRVMRLFRYGDVVYIACESGIVCYEIEKHRYRLIRISSLAGLDVQALFRSLPSKLYIGTEGNGLFCYDLATHQCRNYTRANSDLCSDYIRTIAEDESNNVWVGTLSGLNILGKDGSLMHIDITNADGTSVKRPSVRCMVRDRQGGMWLGTYFNGIYYYNQKKNRFTNIQNIPGANSLANNIIGCITEDRNHNLWIGTNGGLHLYTPTTQHFQLFTTADGLLANDIKALYADQKTGDIYVGSQLGGLAVVKASSRRIQSLATKAHSADDNCVYAICPLDGKQLLLGTLTGLMLYDKTSSRISALPQKMRGDYHCPQRVCSILRDAHGMLWIGGEDGLATYFWQNGTLRRVALPNALKPIEKVRVNTLSSDAKGTVWVGTQQGLYACSAKRAVKVYTDQNGLSGKVVYGILHDSLGKLWVSTNNGLCTFYPDGDKMRCYTTKDGLPSNLFMPNAAYQASDGTMYFGSINGIASFTPDRFIYNPFAPQPFISELKLYDRVVTPGDETGILEKNIALADKITLHHGQTNISFKLSVVNYLAGGHNTFLYQLEGYDSEWHTLDDGQVIGYSYIPAGSYRLLVRAANNDGKWNGTTTELRIEVLPAWYASWVAKIIYLLLFLGMVYALFRHFLDREKKKQEEIRKQKEQQHLQEVYELRQRFFFDISHELRTPLTLIASPLDEIMERQRDGWTRSRLQLMRKSVNRLIHLINQLMDYRRAELNVFKLKVRPVQLSSLIEKTSSFYQESAVKRHMDYHWYCEDKGQPVLCDANYIELILNNLISNAFKYTPDGKSISVSAQVDESYCRLTVQDTGQGIQEEKQNRIFERFYQLDGKHQSGWGIGLSIVARMVELHHGTILLDSKVGVGSTFTITIPIHADAYSKEEIISDGERFNPDIDNLYKGGTPMDLKEDENPDLVSYADVEEELGTLEQEGEKPCLLVAEDNEDIRHYLSQSLANEYRVMEASNGIEALELIREHEVNIVLSDVMMPEMDGIELCTQIKSDIATSHIPVIILSAKVDVSEQLAGLQGGADDYIPKPFSLMIVRTKIHNILRTHRLMIARYKTAKKIEPPKLTVNNLDEQWLEQALKVVNDHIEDEKFSTDDFARLMLMSRTSLYTKMKALTGESVKEFVRRIRLNRAAELILGGEHSISEISFLVGFATPSYFTTSFKRHFGCLPTEYSGEGDTEA